MGGNYTGKQNNLVPYVNKICIYFRHFNKSSDNKI